VGSNSMMGDYRKCPNCAVCSNRKSRSPRRNPSTRRWAALRPGRASRSRAVAPYAAGQVDGKSARAELTVALRVLDGGKAEHLNPVEFLALGLAEPVETVNERPSVDNT